MNRAAHVRAPERYFVRAFTEAIDGHYGDDIVDIITDNWSAFSLDARERMLQALHAGLARYRKELTGRDDLDIMPSMRASALEYVIETVLERDDAGREIWNGLGVAA